MFKIIAEPLVWWPVLFAGVAEDGTVVENKIEMRFVILGEDEMDVVGREAAILLSAKPSEQAAADGDAQSDTVPSSARAASFLGRFVRDWRGVAAANGEALPFSSENLRALMNVPNVFPAILRAYGACRAGRAEVRSGN